MPVPLLAGEAGGRSDLQGGGGRLLPARSVDEVGEDLCLLQQEVKALHAIVNLQWGSQCQQALVGQCGVL